MKAVAAQPCVSPRFSPDGSDLDAHITGGQRVAEHDALANVGIPRDEPMRH